MTFEQAGIAAFLPGMRYALEVLQRQISAMEQQLGLVLSGAGKGGIAEGVGVRKRMSPEGIEAIREAQAKRWAKFHKAQSADQKQAATKATRTPAKAAKQSPAPKKKPAVWTPARRKHAAERMRRVNLERAARKRAELKKGA